MGNVKAKNARSHFNLNLQRKRLPPELRRSKIRVYRKRICSFVYCQSVVVRMENHLKDFHKLSGPVYKNWLKAAAYLEENSTQNYFDEEQPVDSSGAQTCIRYVFKGLLIK